jgi:hypothetical protein
MHDAVAAAMTELMVFAADSGTYEPITGDPVCCMIRIDRAENIDPSDMETISHGVEIRAMAKIGDLGQIPVPKDRNSAGDKFRVLGQLYEVSSIVDRNNVFVFCAVREVDA